MAFNKRVLTRLVVVPVETGRNFTRHSYATDDPKAQVLTADYFNEVSNVLKKNDLIDVVADHKGSGELVTLRVTNVVQNGAVSVEEI